MEHREIFRRPGSILPASLFLLVLLLSSGVCLPRSTAQAASAPAAIKEPSKPSPAAFRTNPIASELESLSASAGEIFNLALAGKMDRTTKKLDALKKNAAVYIRDDTNSILLPRLGRTIADLEAAIAAKDRLDTLRYANRITLIVATVAVPFKPVMPTELSLLDYNGRELEIWSEAKKTDKLSGIVIRMHLAWQTLMPKLIDHNGIKELRRFSDIMGQLETAKSSEEYGRLSRLLLAETETMKVILTKPAK